MSRFLKKFIQLLAPQSTSRLEQFLLSKNLQNNADVEHWTRFYERQGSEVWGRGL